MCRIAHQVHGTRYQPGPVTVYRCMYLLINSKASFSLFIEIFVFSSWSRLRRHADAPYTLQSLRTTTEYSTVPVVLYQHISMYTRIE